VDFIERIFGVSPDGGNGSFELLIFVALIALAAVVFRWVRQRHRL
jgi:hypothetical protein